MTWEGTGSSRFRFGGPFFLDPLLLLAALFGVQDALAHADALGRHFQQLILAQVFNTLVQAHLARRCQALQHICEAGAHFFIGVSARTNEEGARQLAGFLAQEGFTSSLVDIRGVPGILHLKSGLTYLGDNRLVLIDALADRPAFQGYEIIRVEPGENYAANCVRVNDYVLLAAGYPALEAALRHLGYPVLRLEMSEYQKMDGGLSCLSLRF